MLLMISAVCIVIEIVFSITANNWSAVFGWVVALIFNLGAINLEMGG